MSLCKFDGCQTKPRKDKNTDIQNEYCGSHAYRKNMLQCTKIKNVLADGTSIRCHHVYKKDQEGTEPRNVENLCIYHRQKNKNNFCNYVGAKNGLCGKKCLRERCYKHNEKSINKRKDFTREYNNIAYKGRVDKINEYEKKIKDLTKTIDEMSIHLDTPANLSIHDQTD